jgi:hypothetical protein
VDWSRAAGVQLDGRDAATRADRLPLGRARVRPGHTANAPKLKALADTKVALTIDTNDRPYKVLLVRGTATVRMMDGIVPEYVLMAHRCMGDGAETWLKQVEAMLPAWGGMARVAITPEWVGILDFVQRFPSAIEHAMSKTLSA